MYRTLITCTTLALAAGAAAPVLAQSADQYPGKPIRLVIPFPPGGGTDILSRVIANKLTEVTKWTIVPENKAGAGGTIGITEAAKAPATGYEMVMGQKDNLILGPYLYKNLPWNPTKDLTPVAHIAYTPVIIATSVNSPYKSIADVVAAAKASPAKITYGSPGNGTSIHIAGHMFEKAAGVQLTHVPYKGSNPALMDAIAGNVDLLVSSIPSAIAQIKAGKLRPLAVTSPQRNAQLPQVPTTAEAGLSGVEISAWYGIYMPASTPKAVVQKVHDEVNKVIAMPETKTRLEAVGAELRPMAQADFASFHMAEYQRFGDIIRKNNIKLD